ncbi:uncharacterized protein LOC108739694 [Agrilus planipennis]|uniref:Uncharacterized protein LOC108739694 n=1 Tax=Agrilus planipennis TaxID=224129 RepID=A0A1W4XA50_AGRPL|nr:uncharacterized protein LOC108739694 [Agrilus planipennis]
MTSMSVSDKTCASTTPKPSTVFFVWYPELCRRKNINPLINVKAPKVKNGTVLDFVGDRLKIDEWKPILNALYLDQSLHVIVIRSRLSGRVFNFDIDTEDKLRSLNKSVGCLWTDYVMQAIISSVCNCLLKSEVLTTLELDGLPLYTSYFCRLVEAIRRNRYLKVLSLKRAPIKDLGCEELCTSLQYLPHIEVLILCDCDLTHLSGQHIGKLIKYQKLNRYCVTWNNSLRYADPPVEKIAGLRRITLNNNPLIGNEGLEAILHELGDDLWIKAIDMQNCGITEDMADRLIETLHYNKTLDIADFRRNDLSFNTLNKIFDMLRERLDLEGEYHWCLTSTTLDQTDAASTCCPTSANIFHKSQSAPLHNFNPALRSTTNLRKAKTSSDLHKQMKPILPKHSQPRVGFADLHKQVTVLSNRLKEEIRKRIEAENANKNLQKKLEKFQKLNVSQTKQKPQTMKKIGKLMEMLENLGINVENEDNETLANINKILKEKRLNIKTIVMDHIKQSEGNRNGFQRRISNEHARNSDTSNKIKTCSQPQAPVISDGVISGATTATSEAPQSILEKFLYTTDSDREDSEKEDGSDILESYYNLNENFNNRVKQKKKLRSARDRTGSTTSIRKLLKGLEDDTKIPISPAPSLSSDDDRSSIKTVVDRKTKVEKLYQKVPLKVK